MMAVSAADRGKVTFFEDFVGMVITPIQNLCTTISEKSGDFAAIFTEHKQLTEENEKLKTELASVSRALRDAQQYQLENESLRGMLEIKEARQDFVFESALIVAAEQSGYSYTLTLNKGSVNDVSKRDIVITSDGVVGYISELGTTWCKVTTVLDSSCEIGALIPRTQDVGVLEGEFSLASEGNCKLSYLGNEVQLSAGDSVVTSGIGGVFPAQLMIGNIVEIKPESHGISQYAVIEPAVNFDDLKNVFIVTDFTENAKEQQD
jgi:rod shape-determining protein MreC